MGFLSTIEGLAAQQGQSGTGSNVNAAVLPGLLQSLDQHPGGLSGIIQQFQSNGMSGPVQQWATGQQQTATPEQVQQGLGGSGFIEKVAAQTGISPQVAQVAIAALLPMVIAHFTHGGQQPAPQNIEGSGFAGMASMLMGKLL